MEIFTLFPFSTGKDSNKFNHRYYQIWLICTDPSEEPGTTPEYDYLDQKKKGFSKL